MPSVESRSFECACGRTAHEGRGQPIATVACYCKDCQAAGHAIAARPNGRGGVAVDGGMVSSLFRIDRVACVRGAEHLVDHKLRPASHTIRVVAACCNSNVLTRFDNGTPIIALRAFTDVGHVLPPDVCVYTKHAPDPKQIRHAAPRYAGLAPKLVVRVLRATLGVALTRLPWLSRRR